MKPSIDLRLNDWRRASRGQGVHGPTGRQARTPGAPAGPVEAAPTRLLVSSLRRSSAPRIRTDPKARATRADRFLARGCSVHTQTFPGLSARWLERGWGSLPPSAYALAAHSCRDSRRSEADKPPTAFPIKPPRASARFVVTRHLGGRPHPIFRLRQPILWRDFARLSIGFVRPP